MHRAVCYSVPSVICSCPSGTKDSLFRAIQEQSDVPFEEMLFFDNETPNIRSVAPLGVTTIYCPKGLTADVWGPPPF